MTVAQILKSKGRNVVTASPNDSVRSIASTLTERRIGAVVIIEQDGSINGIVSERDIVHAIAKNGPKALDMKARQIMTADVHTCEPADSEAELMTLMTNQRIRHLPVIEQCKLAGMISIGDVVKYRIEAIEREADEMKHYIAQAG
jgi:CBS domain-containing protein